MEASLEEIAGPPAEFADRPAAATRVKAEQVIGARNQDSTIESSLIFNRLTHCHEAKISTNAIDKRWSEC